MFAASATGRGRFPPGFAAQVQVKEELVSVYSISLFLHIVGALGLFAVLGLEWASLHHLRRAAEVAQAREWVRLLGAPRFLGGPAALIILATGIHMTATRWGPQGWIVVGLAGMVLIAVLGPALGGRRVGLIARALRAEDGLISQALRQRLHDPVLTLSLRLRIALFFGVVFIMSTQPGIVGALAAMAVALLVGLVAAFPAWSSDRRPAPMSASER
jgi:hypothetical protein